MYDFAVPNARPGQCAKCRGTGQQSQRDIRRNVAYNRHKLANIRL